MFEILTNDYEITSHILADEIRSLIKKYIEEMPSVFYNVDKYSAEFSKWLFKQDISLSAKEMADLEYKISEVFNMAESEPLLQKDLENIDAEKFSELNLKPRTAHLFAHYKNNVNDFMTSFYEDKASFKLQEAENFVIIYRSDDIVYRLNLEKEEYSLLKALSAGKNISEAMEECASQTKMGEDELAAKIQLWFGRWINSGVLQKLKY